MKLKIQKVKFFEKSRILPKKSPRKNKSTTSPENFPENSALKEENPDMFSRNEVGQFFLKKKEKLLNMKLEM